MNISRKLNQKKDLGIPFGLFLLKLVKNHSWKHTHIEIGKHN